MVRSMTGFGREQRIIDGREIIVEIRSVNHRYYEAFVKLQRQYGYIEEKLKLLVADKVNRGKVEIHISISSLSGKELQVTINQGIVESYVNALRSVDSGLNLKDDLKLSDIFRMTDAFNIVKTEIDEDEIWRAVSETAAAALEKFIAMREDEGGRIKKDILKKLGFIEKTVFEVDRLYPQIVERYRTKLYEKIKETISTLVTDKQRILMEAAIFAEKTAVDEETVRLKSHIIQIRGLIENESVIGRKLDFLIQEMNREVNTIGSKTHDIIVTQLVVDLKSELEKIREQIQNIE